MYGCKEPRTCVSLRLHGRSIIHCCWTTSREQPTSLAHTWSSDSELTQFLRRWNISDCWGPRRLIVTVRFIAPSKSAFTLHCAYIILHYSRPLLHDQSLIMLKTNLMSSGTASCNLLTVFVRWWSFVLWVSSNLELQTRQRPQPRAPATEARRTTVIVIVVVVVVEVVKFIQWQIQDFRDESKKVSK